MANKLTIFLFTAAILHSIAGMPTQNESTIRARAQMLLNIIEDYTEFMLESLQHDKPLIQKVLNDPSIKNNQALHLNTIAIATTINRLDDYKSQAKSMYIALFPVISSVDFSNLNDFIDKYNTAPTRAVSAEQQLFRAALASNGVRDGDMSEDLMQRFKQQTSVKLLNTIDGFIDALPFNEQLDQADVVEFRTAFRSENNARRKYDLFRNFFKTEKDNLDKLKQQLMH